MICVFCANNKMHIVAIERIQPIVEEIWKSNGIFLFKSLLTEHLRTFLLSEVLHVKNRKDGKLQYISCLKISALYFQLSCYFIATKKELSLFMEYRIIKK